MFQCGCDGGAQPKFIDPFGYHVVGCKVGANSIRLHDEVALLLAKLFRRLRLDAIVESIRLFAEAPGDRNSQRPDVLLRSPRGFGRQIILDVAVTDFLTIVTIARRNVAFKVARMRESIMEEGQDEPIIRKSDSEEVGLEYDK